jgi:16S rRNA (cytosine967-C5)-methyltransferase
MQRELLHAAACCVKPGGVLVYSTCSIEAEENQGQMKWLLQTMPSFHLDTAACENLPESVVREGKYMLCLPFLHGSDGSFGVRFRKAVNVNASDNG